LSHIDLTRVALPAGQVEKGPRTPVHGFVTKRHEIDRLSSSDPRLRGKLVLVAFKRLERLASVPARPPNALMKEHCDRVKARLKRCQGQFVDRPKRRIGASERRLQPQPQLRKHERGSIRVTLQVHIIVPSSPVAPLVRIYRPVDREPERVPGRLTSEIALRQVTKMPLAKPEHAPIREALELDVRLREASAQRSRASAEAAVELAVGRRSRYREHTARVLAGMIALPEDPGASRDHFETVLLAGNDASWLYRAECWFGLGCLALESKDRITAYRYLVAAQYVYGLLGLQPMPHTGLSLPSAEEPVCLPSHILRAPQFRDLSHDQCEHLRQLAIVESGLRDGVLDALSGWGSPYGNLPANYSGIDPVAV